MVIQKFISVAGVLVMVVLALKPVPAIGADKFRPLRMYGESYPNVCLKAEQEALMNELSLHQIKNEAQAWRLIATILCSPDDNVSRTYVRTLLSGKLRRKSESTADKPSYEVLVPGNRLVSEVMAFGSAWSASVRVESDELVLQYFSNEACVKGVRFAYVASRWTIHELSEACD
jgi:hypothetical protein